jgi:hypothetical protein
MKLDPNEHYDCLWVTEEDYRNHQVERDEALVEYKFTRAVQEATILEGFRLRKQARQDGQ